MIGKLIKKVLGLGSNPVTTPMNNQQPNQFSGYPSGHPQYPPGYQQPPIDPQFNPYINPSADWNYYNQLVANQQFVQQQSQQVSLEYQQQQMYSQVLDNMRSFRAEHQSQQLASGASPEYYAKLNAAYRRGIDKMSGNSKI